MSAVQATSAGKAAKKASAAKEAFDAKLAGVVEYVVEAMLNTYNLESYQQNGESDEEALAELKKDIVKDAIEHAHSLGKCKGQTSSGPCKSAAKKGEEYCTHHIDGKSSKKVDEKKTKCGALVAHKGKQSQCTRNACVDSKYCKTHVNYKKKDISVCTATKSKGEACTAPAKDGCNGMCKTHFNKAAAKKDSKDDVKTEVKKCAGKTAGKKQCSRNAMKGCDYCKSHKSIKEKNESKQCCTAHKADKSKCTAKVSKNSTTGKFCGRHLKFEKEATKDEESTSGDDSSDEEEEVKAEVEVEADAEADGSDL